METWVTQMIRTRLVRRATAWALALGCVVLFAFAQPRYVRNFLSGPFELGQSDLDEIADVTTAPCYFVSVTGSKAIDTGIQNITVRKRGGVETSRSVSACYYALLVGDRFLIVKSSAGALTTMEGELKAIPQDIDRLLFEAPEMKAIRSHFYPYYLDDGSFRFPGYAAIIAALIFGFLAMKYGFSAWRYNRDPSSHPIVSRVSSWGDPIGIALETQREARSPRHESGGWLVTDNYLIQSTFFKYDLLRFSDLLWAYKSVTKHSVNFIPTGKTYKALLICYGGSGSIKGSEGAVDTILTFAAERAPWAVFGFSEELQKLFRKNTQDFCAAVERRRRDWAQQVGKQSNVSRSVS